MEIIDRMKESLNLSSDAELSRFLNLSSTSVVSQWRKRNKIPYKECINLSIDYGISIVWLMTGQGHFKMAVNPDEKNGGQLAVNLPKMAVNSDKNVTLMSLNSENPSDNPLLRSTKVDIDIEEYIVVPLYDVYFSAGGGSFLDEETIVDYLLFNKSILNEHPAISKNLAGVKVKGDSMYPTLDDDDVVVIDMDTSKTANIFSGLYALNIDGKAYTKRLAINSQNPKEITIISDNKAHYPEETIPKANLNIIGQIIWHGKFLI